MWRYNSDWMVIWDDRALEILFSRGTGTPSEVVRTNGMNISRSHITKRLSKLAENGLVKNLGNGVYRLEIEGVGYLLGLYDVQNDDWIELSDTRLTVSQLHNESNKWAILPDYAETYDIDLGKIRDKIYKNNGRTSQEEQSNVVQEESVVDETPEVNPENLTDATDGVSPMGVGFATSTLDESNEPAVPAADFSEDPSDSEVRRYISLYSLENAKEKFPNYDFSRLDTPENSE
ncbi:hypothetical protein [Halorubrum ezzemoulense]|uniref:hypothetical protein n=1 Tax=Halorubrum ezzemoulense TaxID=337243 RepID=UPI00232FD6D5|nr:hypothetical protein [Halorubrum ezzemoulense]MDB2242704.1 hypothetical protein [Halorubrum ezzemoulense]